MQLAGAQQNTPSNSSFAGLLASLAGPARQRSAAQVPAWIDESLEEDIATLSYERALRAHARYRATPLPDAAFVPPPPAAAAKREPEPPPAVPLQAAPAPVAAAATPAAEFVEAAEELALGQEKGLKCASVTIRLSQEEDAQLRKRAAEAGLTVSAYLRSCTFEAERLRSLVKETLAELKRSNAVQRTQQPPSERGGWHWLWRLLIPRSPQRQSLSA